MKQALSGSPEFRELGGWARFTTGVAHDPLETPTRYVSKVNLKARRFSF